MDDEVEGLKLFPEVTSHGRRVEPDILRGISFMVRLTVKFIFPEKLVDEVYCRDTSTTRYMHMMPHKLLTQITC